MEYSKREISIKLVDYFQAGTYQLKEDYDNEYYVIGKDEDKHIEVVNTKVAISNEEDFAQNKNEFLWDVIEKFIDNGEPEEIGAYKKIAKNLYYREF